MAVTAFPAAGDAPNLTLLNVSRLFTRLEHNLLSPGSELRTLRRSEFQRLRVTKNVEYARTLLSQLERSLPQLKPLDRRHEAHSEIARDRQLLKRMQTLLDEEEVRAHDTEPETDEADGEWAEILAKPIAEEKVVSSAGGQGEPQLGKRGQDVEANEASGPAAPASAPVATPSAAPTSTLRNRGATGASPAPGAKATGSRVAPTDNEKLESTEHALSDQRLEQEDLTNSLLSLASQLKASSHNFHNSLESEQSVLDRAVHGIDRTSSTMEAAGQRMGMLRCMTEGKGWWGRMMLYAWIFGLWVIAILIVFVGPKFRF